MLPEKRTCIYPISYRGFCTLSAGHPDIREAVLCSPSVVPGASWPNESLPTCRANTSARSAVWVIHVGNASDPTTKKGEDSPSPVAVP